MNSQVFDHTSLIRFIEKRFNTPLETNITPWRRAVAGDLTSAFDFVNPNEFEEVQLPDTSSFKPTNLVTYPSYTVVPPANQALPNQEPGVRPARALPYTLNAHGLLQPNGSFLIVFENTGAATAVFQVRSASALHAPRTYTVEPGKSLSDTWPLTSLGLGNCDLSVYGPNGFFREFTGSVSGLQNAQLDVRAFYNTGDNGIALQIANPSSQTANVTIVDRYTGKKVNLTVNAGRSDSRYFSLMPLFGWYDFVITVASDPSVRYEFAGHVETGRDSISDPALGGLANFGGDQEGDGN